jgi:NAD(P)-dependent dehydrogenase (short-subunit alcohol dehydrogenase family)
MNLSINLTKRTRPYKCDTYGFTQHMCFDVVIQSHMDYKNLFDLTGKHALVIGAGSGIGKEAALGLAAFGANVACADVRLEPVQSLTQDLPNASAYSVDLGKQASVNELIEGLPGLDILVCTPSINVRKRLLEYTEADFDKVVSLNLKGSFFAMQAAGKRMNEQGSGSIILFSSIRSQVVEPGQGVYAATKAGTLQMVRALAAELGERNVRVNAIAPGVVETPLTAQIKNNPDWYNAYAQKSALGRWAQPSELVGAVIYLASNAASFVTGSLLLVDGGWTAIDGRFTPPL